MFNARKGGYTTHVCCDSLSALSFRVPLLPPATQKIQCLCQMQTRKVCARIGPVRASKPLSCMQLIFAARRYCWRIPYCYGCGELMITNLSPTNAEIPSVSWYFISGLEKAHREFAREKKRKGQLTCCCFPNPSAGRQICLNQVTMKFDSW